MAEEPKTVTAQQPVLEKLVDAPHAPFVLFDAVATQGTLGGMILVTLAAVRQLPSDDGSVHSHPVVTAFLRTSVAGAVDLRNALDAAIAMATPMPEGRPN